MKNKLSSIQRKADSNEVLLKNIKYRKKVKEMKVR